MLISSCCDDHLFNTFLSGFCPVFTSSSVDQDAFAATVWNIPRDVPVTPPFWPTLAPLGYTSICTFPASDLRAWLPITRIKIRPRKQTYWAAKFLVVISCGKPSGSSGIRLPPTQSTDFPESLEHSSVYVACKTVSVLHSARSLVSNATRRVHAFKWTSCSDSLCKSCNTVESTWLYVALPPYHALFVASRNSELSCGICIQMSQMSYQRWMWFFRCFSVEDHLVIKFAGGALCWMDMWRASAGTWMRMDIREITHVTPRFSFQRLETKESISSSTDTGFYVNKTGITQCPHCQSSFWQPLRISFQSRFSRFDNISHVMISFSNPGWRMTRMRTCLIFGDRPNLLISCCIPAIPRFILQSDVKDT